MEHQQPNRIRIKQSRAELRHILAREHKGKAKETDPERKQELSKYLASVGMGLRHKQAKGV